jgi:predicted DNA-binding WGR domain protein
LANRESYLVFVDFDNNNNKWWKITQQGGSITTTWGRVGENTQTKSWDFGSEYDADKQFEKKCREKQRKGYSVVDVAGVTNVPQGNTTSLSNTQLASVALQEINTNNDTVKSLIQFLTEQNIHAILENTQMAYNSVTGVFTTPLGVVVSQGTIDLARTLLADIKRYTQQYSCETSDFKAMASKYLRLIPQSLGHASRKLDASRIFGDDNLLIKQADLLDSLEASLQTIATAPTPSGETVARPKTFDCKLHLSTRASLDAEIRKIYKSTWQTIHESSKF